MAQAPEIVEERGEPEVGEGDDLARLRARLERFDQRENATGDLSSIGQRLLEVTSPLRAALVGLPLPLPHDRFEEARTAVDTQLACARIGLQVLQQMRSPFLLGFRDESEVVEGGLQLLADAFETCCISGLSAPQGFWLTAHGLFQRVRDQKASSGAAIYKRLLALSTIQPESFTSAELVQVFAMVSAYSDLGDLLTGVGSPAGQGWFWVDFAQDSAPVAVVRRDPPPVDDLGYFSAAALAKAASDRLAKRAQLGVAAPADPADEAVEGAGEALLRRLRERWAMPPRRTQPRRRSEYSVQVCSGLGNIWDRLALGRNSSVVPMEWTVQNESPGGFAIMSVSGVTGDLDAGMALALRRDDSSGWAVCVVRWIRSEQPGQCELGLQLVSQAAIPVRVAFRNGPSSEAPVAALVLPPLAGVRRHQAVLAPAGTYASRRFILVHDVPQRLYVAQGRLLSLDMQTEAVELFQFEVDPYPI